MIELEDLAFVQDVLQSKWAKHICELDSFTVACKDADGHTISATKHAGGNVTYKRSLTSEELFVYPIEMRLMHGDKVLETVVLMANCNQCDFPKTEWVN